MQDLKVRYISTEALVPYAGNARVHSAKQINQIAKSIKTFGFITPVLIDANDTLIAGHGRVLAAKQLKLNLIPAIRVEHLSEAQRRAYGIADNKITENADWDNDLLRIEIDYLMSIDPDFDIDLTGFSTPELNLIIGPQQEAELHVAEVAVPHASEVVSQIGDIWTLGDHRILCGDSRQSEPVARLFGDKTARMVITDPPYNVPIAGHVSGLGQHQHGDFVMGVGEMSPGQFTEFLLASLKSMAGPCVDGALLYCFMDWRHVSELLKAGDAANLSLLNVCVWVKSNGGMGSLYRSQYELVAVFKKGSEQHVNNVDLGKHGRYRTNVWQYAGMNSFGSERDEVLALHPTVKPMAMIRDAILDVSHIGDIVLDGFLGSGTTLLAADQSKRRCFGVELDPGYVDVAIRRWMLLTGGEAVHESGISFEEMSTRRRSAAAA